MIKLIKSLLIALMLVPVFVSAQIEIAPLIGYMFGDG